MKNWYQIQSFGSAAFAWQKHQRDLLLLPADEREALIHEFKQTYFKPLYADFVAHGWTE